MKKAVVILLLVIYGSATMGATVHMHYCMNRLISSNIWGSKSEVCDNCGMDKEKSHGCCRDVCKQIKLQADQQLTSAGYTIPAFAQAIVPPFICNTVAQLSSIIIVQPVSHAPPSLQYKKLYLQNNAWLI